MLFDRPQIWLLDPDPESREMLALMGKDLCEFVHDDSIDQYLAIAARVQAVFVDIDTIGTKEDATLAYVREHHPELPVIICSATVGYRFVMPFMVNHRAVFLRKPFQRANLAAVLAGIYSAGNTDTGHDLGLSWLYGAKQKFKLSKWTSDGMGSLLVTGEPGCGKTQIVGLVGSKLGLEYSVLDAAEEHDISLQELKHCRAILLKNIEQASESFLHKIVGLMLICRCKTAKWIAPVILATANDAGFLSQREEHVAIKSFFGDWIVELAPLRERWVEFRKICRHLFNNYCHAMKKEYPVDFSHDSYQLLSRHQWPGNLAELERLVTKCAEKCEGPYVTSDCLRKVGWTPDYGRKG